MPSSARNTMSVRSRSIAGFDNSSAASAEARCPLRIPRPRAGAGVLPALSSSSTTQDSLRARADPLQPERAFRYHTRDRVKIPDQRSLDIRRGRTTAERGGTDRAASWPQPLLITIIVLHSSPLRKPRALRPPPRTALAAPGRRQIQTYQSQARIFRHFRAFRWPGSNRTTPESPRRSSRTSADGLQQRARTAERPRGDPEAVPICRRFWNPRDDAVIEQSAIAIVQSRGSR